MDQVGSSTMDLDSDIDLESGGTMSEKDARKGQALSDENSNMSIMSSSESSYGSTDVGERTPYENLASNLDEIYYKNREMQFMKLREGIENYVDKKKVKKHTAARPPRPHRPKGPLLGPYDLKLVKEISELNSKRRKMGRIRAFNKMRRQKPSSMKSSLLAFLVTMIFFLIIISQGLLGTRV